MDEQKRGSMSDGYLPPDHIDEDFEEEFDDNYADEGSDEDGSDKRREDQLAAHASPEELT